jgi:gamma-glutamyltranspeptidase
MTNSISYAENDFEVDSFYHCRTKFRLAVLQRYQSSRDILLHNGEMPELGSLIKISYQYGNMHAIVVNHDNGQLDAASDPRVIGVRRLFPGQAVAFIKYSSSTLDHQVKSLS